MPLKLPSCNALEEQHRIEELAPSALNGGPYKHYNCHEIAMCISVILRYIQFM